MALVEMAFDGTEAAVESNADRAYEVIRERLVMLDIRPGEPINDDRLAAELAWVAHLYGRHSSGSYRSASSSAIPGGALSPRRST
jgi:hypothetical protein